MSALKFTCPSCGQHMQCEKAYVGHQIPCPSCGAQLRVPMSDAAGGGPNALPRAELIVAPGDPQGMPAIKSAASEITQEIIVHAEPKKTVTPPPIGQPPEIHCVCPVCQSELKVPFVPSGSEHPTMAELVNTAPTSSHDSTASPPASSEASLSERERQIAAARAAHPVGIHPAVKPRLSYVMNGGTAPTEGENKQEGDDTHARAE